MSASRWLQRAVRVLFPFMLVASGRWRAFGAAAVTALVLIALSAVLFGPEVWVDYVTRSLPNQRMILRCPVRKFVVNKCCREQAAIFGYFARSR